MTKGQYLYAVFPVFLGSGGKRVSEFGAMNKNDAIFAEEKSL